MNRKPATANDFYRSAIPIDRIDLSDSTYRITTAPVSDDLQQSITLAGLVNPPLLKALGRGWIVVSGFRRLEACRRLGWTDVAARVLNDGADELACIRLAIADNQGQRPLNIVELSRAVGLLDRLPGNGGLAQRAQAAGLAAGVAYLQKAQRVGHLPLAVQEGLLTEAIALPVALELEKLAIADALALAGLLKSLRASLNRQREILTMVQEIAARDGIGLAALIADEPIAALVGDGQTDCRQKTEALRRHLQQQRHPHLSAAQSRFAGAVKALDLEPGIELAPPAHFESTTYTLTLRFDNPAQLAQKATSLQELLDHPGLPGIFER